ncbi:MAG: immunoglobulin domain-containing protein, partial [Vicinamibacterales bacterium]
MRPSRNHMSDIQRPHERRRLLPNRHGHLLAGVAMVALLAVGVVTAQRASGTSSQDAADPSSAALIPEVGQTVAFAVSRPVAEIPEEIPLRATSPEGTVRPLAALPGAQTSAVSSARTAAPQPVLPLANMPQPLAANFDGVSSQDVADAFGGNRIVPPNTNGDVGPNHYVQAVDVLVRIYQKDGTPSSAKPTPFKLSQLFSQASFPGLCSTRNDGNATVLYDQLSDRWVLTQTAFTGSLTPPYHQCVAVSQSADPAGTYFLYDFALPTAYDSPRFGVWRDGYYLAANELTGSGAFAGVGVFAFDRTKLLAGNANAGFIGFHLGTYFTVSTAVSGMLPADLDGPTPPPAGTPSYFAALGPRLSFLDTGGMTDTIRLFAFHADFANPPASTFVERPESPRAVATFDSRSNRIEQPAPATASAYLEALQDRLTGRLAYRNFGGTSESLVVTHTVNIGPNPATTGGHQAAVRYYEFRRALPSGFFGVPEQATFGPDADNRWMASAALDMRGNLAVGYSVSGATTFPSIRYAGRLATDPPNGLQQGEATLIDGSGVQLDTSGKWGALSSLVLDPADDCRFWYTTEYYTLASQGSSSMGWLTRIGSFRYPSCGVLPTITTQPVSQTVAAGANVTFTVAASGTPVPTYQWQISSGGGAFTDLTNTAPYSGVTTPTLTLTNLALALSGNQYRAVATNSVGAATSTAATLTVTMAPIISMQPTNQTVNAGQNATFTALATGNPTPTYQWQISTNGGTSFSNLANVAPYSGVTTGTLTITGATVGLTGNQYRVVATNSAGTATSTAATLTVTAIPVITTPPTNQSVAAGATATFTVAASGTPTPTYQWQVAIGGGAFTDLTNTAPYSGVTTATLTVTSATVGLTGNQYRAVATNSAGSAVSAAATLTVNVSGGSLVGVWSGPTGQGLDLTFAVGSDGITRLLVSLNVGFSPPCPGIVGVLVDPSPATPITNNSFTLNVSTTGGLIGTIVGSFQSGTAAAGTLSFASAFCSANTTWTAIKHPDQGVQVVTVTATDPTAAEIGPDPGTFTITRAGSTAFDLLTSFTVAGTATAADFSMPSAFNATIPAGQASTTVTVTPILDALGAEGPETVVLTLVPGLFPEYTIGTPSAATVTIADSPQTVTVVATDPVASEIGPDPGTFTISRAGDTTLPLSVSYTLGGNATHGTDYSFIFSPVTIPAGQA